MMSHSGARGSPTQMKQLAAMRGWMTEAVWRDHREPDHLELQEGLTVLEYFNSTHGARQGPRRHGSETANSGYLTAAR